MTKHARSLVLWLLAVALLLAASCPYLFRSIIEIWG